jgi:hypothetical protein
MSSLSDADRAFKEVVVTLRHRALVLRVHVGDNGLVGSDKSVALNECAGTVADSKTVVFHNVETVRVDVSGSTIADGRCLGNKE